MILGINSNIEILDITVKSEYPSLFDTWVNFVDGVQLKYSIINRQNFEAVKYNYRKIKKIKGKNCEIVLVGKWFKRSKKSKYSKRKRTCW